MVSEKNTKQELLDEYKKLVTEAKSKKITLPAGAAGLNSKNNKTDILNAIQAIEQALSQPVSAPAPVPEAPKTPAKPAKPAVTPKTSPVKEEENDLIYLKPEIKAEIEALDSAKALRKKEYDNLLAIEQELVSFVAMINKKKSENLTQEEAHASQKSAQEETIAKAAEKQETDAKEKLEAVNKEFTEAEEKIASEKEALINERAVEEEQYRYDLNKKQKQEDDLWADELAKREEVISAVQKETADLQKDIDSKADFAAELQAKIDEIPQLIEKAKLEGAEAKEKELGKEYGYKTNMAKKDADVAAQSLQKQIDRLKADYEAVLAEKNAIQQKLDKAYEESNKLYMQTVQSTGGVKILSNIDLKENALHLEGVFHGLLVDCFFQILASLESRSFASRYVLHFAGTGILAFLCCTVTYFKHTEAS